MVTGATSLSLVRDELFATMEEAEQSLEHFIIDRNNGSLLQQAVENLKQVRGTLRLIELTGAELLAQEILQLATDIPVGAGEDRDTQLASLSNALYVLGRYLESVDASRQEMPELLLPPINALRLVSGQSPLPESFFFSVRLDHARPPIEAAVRQPTMRAAEARRLRQMYQVGLLGFIREDNASASLKLMARALGRLDLLFANTAGGRLCWLGSAAVEAQLDGQLLPRQSRKHLFSRLDRELRQLSSHDAYEPPRVLLKELLYLVALAESSGPLASEVRETFSLGSLPFTDHLLEDESQRLAGPGQAVMRSLSSAIREELASLKDLLDLIERQTAPAESYPNLHSLLGKLAKTLGMVGLSSASSTL
ncbi:MAG TPA: ferrous iron transporter B, partial [Pseudomonas sp.]|nr:ferrous iron transporter B [Pseudomonas sp.]